MLTTVVDELAAEWPTEPEPDRSLERSLAFLDADVAAAEWLAAAYALAAGVLAMVPVAMVLVPAGFQAVAAMLLVTLAVAVVVGARDGPQFLARVRRTRALGAAPTLLTFASLRMRLEPVPERAARFAGEAVRGPLGDSLEGHADRSVGAPEAGFAGFAREWGEWFPAVERGSDLLTSAASAQPERREALLDRARNAVLEGTHRRMADFGGAIRGPATGIYAFGVFLPLALAALTPALRAAGVPTPVALIGIVYDLLLPAILVGATAWLLSRRPMAFPPPDVDRSHPDVPDSPALAILAGGAAAMASWALARQFLQPWTPPLAAAGAGVGVGLVVAYRPMVAVRKEVEAVEDGLGDALAMIGRRVAGGTAVERAIPDVAAEVEGPTGDLLADVAGRQRRLGVDLERAMIGPTGALATLPSDRLRGGAAMLSMAAREGAPAGDAIVALSGHLEDLDRVERETRRSIDNITGTLSNTAALFGPLVGGVTVALASAMGGPGPFDGAGNVAGLGLAVGIYVLLLAVILTVLTTGLTRGVDRPLAGYRSGLALLSATATYLAAVAAGGLIV